jgi:hypothetical protein
MKIIEITILTLVAMGILSLFGMWMCALLKDDDE